SRLNQCNWYLVRSKLAEHEFQPLNQVLLTEHVCRCGESAIVPPHHDNLPKLLGQLHAMKPSVVTPHYRTSEHRDSEIFAACVGVYVVFEIAPGLPIQIAVLRTGVGIMKRVLICRFGMRSPNRIQAPYHVSAIQRSASIKSSTQLSVGRQTRIQNPP